MTIRDSKPENTNATELPDAEAPLSLEQIEEIEHRHEDVGATLREHLVREDLAVAAEDERRTAARKGHQEAREVTGAPVVASEHRAAVLEAYRRCCAYCEKTGGLGLTLLVSAASGGKPTLTNTVPACMACRKALRGRDALDWLDGHEKLDTATVFARINAATLQIRKGETLRRAA